METQHLTAFLSVARHGSFTHAADELFLTQPAISKRIAALEQQLNCHLFDRIGRSVSLTESGRALLPRAEAILQSVKDTQLALANLSGEVRGPLRLATSHHIGLHHLPRILKPYTHAYPQVELSLAFIDSEQATESLLRGDIEMALVTLADPNLNPQPASGSATSATATAQNIQSFPLWHDPLDIVVAKDHPIAQLERPSLRDLARFNAILPAINTHTTRLVQQLFNTANLKLELSMATNYLETIKMMVSIGLGWSALPHSISREGTNELQIINIDGAHLSRTLGCLVHANRSLSNAAEQFLQALQDNRRM